jgi:acyl-CoA thioesterase I
MEIIEGGGPVVLFQGDSITDTFRKRDVADDLGQGYASIAAAWYQALYPEHMVRFVNRGIDGNTVLNLKDRWQEDCIDLKPDLVSILIGVNDTSCAMQNLDNSSLEEFEAAYRDILCQTKETGADLLLIEPFVLPYPDSKLVWRKELDARIFVVRTLAREFEATLVPMDGLFAQAAARREPVFWSYDGIHPSAPGHALIAQAWLDAAEDLI